MFIPEISKSSIVTADNELRQAATVPKLAAKILQNKKYCFEFITAFMFHFLPSNEKSDKELDVSKNIPRIWFDNVKLLSIVYI